MPWHDRLDPMDSRQFPEVELRVVCRGQTVVTLQQSDVLQSFEYSYGVNVSWTATLHLFDRNFDFIETVLHGLGFGTEIAFRFGWKNGPSFPWTLGVIREYEAKLTPGGEEITLVVQSPDAAVAQFRGSYVFPSGTQVTEAVKIVAKLAGIEDDKIVVEPFYYRRDQIPPLRPDQTFANWLHRMVELIGGTDGGSGLQRGPYSFRFDPDGRFYFTTGGYGGITLHDAYVYGHVNDGRVRSMEITDLRPIMWSLGAQQADVVFVSPDDLTAQSARVDNLEARRHTLSDGTRVDDVVRQLGLRNSGFVQVSDVDSSREEAQIRALQRWRLFAEYTFVVDMEVVGDPLVPLYSYIYLRVVKRDGTPHYMCGYYCVRRVVHTISDSGFVTKLNLIRNAINVGDLMAAGVKTEAILRGAGGGVEERGLQSILYGPEFGFLVGRYSNRGGHASFVLSEREEITPGVPLVTRVTNAPHDSRVTRYMRLITQRNPRDTSGVRLTLRPQDVFLESENGE